MVLGKKEKVLMNIIYQKAIRSQNGQCLVTPLELLKEIPYKVDFKESELDEIVREKKMSWFCDKQDVPLERYITDPILLKSQQFYQKRVTGMSVRYFRDYVSFALENEERLDALFIGYVQAKSHLREGKIAFRDLSPEAEKMLSARKLWDFMEDIPGNEDPRAVCRNILEELLRKAAPAV